MPDCDGFATADNAVEPVFYAVCPQVGCAGVDFFAQSLSPDIRYFLCPLVKVISRLVHFLSTTPGLTFLLVVPDWPSASFWAVLHPGGPHILWCVFACIFCHVFSLFTLSGVCPLQGLLLLCWPCSVKRDFSACSTFSLFRVIPECVYASSAIATVVFAVVC